MSAPVELYRFVLDTEIWTYTSSDTEVTYNSENYTPVPLGRGQAESRNELSRASLDVRLDVLDTLAQRMLTSYTEKVLGLTLYIKDGATINIGWKGRLSSIKPSGNQLTLSFESVFTSLRRPGLRARFQKVCRHVLYGRGCTLNSEDFATPGIASSVSANVVVVPEAATQADGWWLGGMLRGPDGILGFIVGHAGSVLTLQRQIDSLIVAKNNSGYGLNYGNYYGGVNVTIYPGCDRLRGTCESKFNNLDNHGGFPWIPSTNPFGGSSIV